MTRRVVRLVLARLVSRTWLALLVGPTAQPPRPRAPIGVDVDTWTERNPAS